MVKSPIATAAARADDVKKTPKLSKRERAYRKALALVAMAKPDIMSPQSTRGYKQAKDTIARHEASVAAAKRGAFPSKMENDENMMSPHRKKAKTTFAVYEADQVKSPERRVWSPSIMSSNEAFRAKSPEERVLSPSVKHKYAGMTPKTAVFQTPPSIRYANANENASSKTLEFDLTQHGDDEVEEEVFYTAKQMGSPSILVKSNVKEPKTLYFQCYPNETQAEADEEWQLWKGITWKYLTGNPCLVISVVVFLCLCGMPWLLMFARLL